MFLNLLEKDEKAAFLEISHHFAWSNNDFSDTQKSSDCDLLLRNAD